jgi:alpha-D-ribose 1-methylphosphonate 5-triphosphate synthase subunit PhnH
VLCDLRKQYPNGTVALGRALGIEDDADRGTELEPEGGATIVRVGGVPPAAVLLSGPGPDGELRTTLPLRASELAARARAGAAYPLGIDLVLIDAAGAHYRAPPHGRRHPE